MPPHTIIRIQRSNTSRPVTEKGHGLIMSATLVPPGPAVARSDPGERLNDYIDALRYYISLPNTAIDRILFVDNSDSDLTPLAEVLQHLPHEKTIELVSFSGNNHPYQLGKAYGEFKLMDYGLAHTTLFGPEDVIWKTTGRLKFLNLPEMIANSKTQDFDVLCDLHNVPWIGSGKWRDYQNMDLRIFAFRRKAYDSVFRDLWKDNATGFNAEFMYRWIRRVGVRLKIIPRLPLQPKLQGISGRHQRDYQSASQRTKDAVRGTVRRIIPWLWL